MLVHVRGAFSHTVLGSTLDDAAGECFDKTAKLIGLAYPGGPEIDKFAKRGDPNAIDLPRPMLKDANDDFSFSGLKTAVRYFIRDHPNAIGSEQGVCDLCASVQAAIVEVLVKKTIRAAKRLAVRCITASGGVTCNSSLRQELAIACAAENIELRLADRALCTDNAAMIAILAERKLLAGAPRTDLDAEVRPSWPI
jgi:N6-L-threonylcarbamoyladenine synthase